jgi:hypothetical protein
MTVERFVRKVVGQPGGVWEESSPDAKRSFEAKAQRLLRHAGISNKTYSSNKEKDPLTKP